MENELPNRKNIRWKGFDYSSLKDYFVTIVVHERLQLLGHIDNGEMIKNAAGEMTESFILEFPNKFPKTTIVCYVIMPNHIHFILRNEGGHHLSEMIRWFKSITTVNYIKGVKEKGWIRFNKTFWQHSYHDHVIRTSDSFRYIETYIATNPLRWSTDSLHIN